MLNESFFGMNPYHVAMAAIGGGMILAYWIPRFFSGREPAASTLLILSGALAYTLIPGMPAVIDPRTQPRVWELTSEFAVIVALFGTGLRIDNLSSYQKWRPTVRLLVIVMPLTIAAVALLGWLLAGMTLAGALLLGAVLAPTDPVLAGDVQVGPPTEGGEHPVRFSLTAEAGLNDGLTFPFVYLGLIIAAEGFAPESWGMQWLALDVFYRIIVGLAAGAALGWLIGRLLFLVPRRNALANTGSGVLALAGILVCYGATELIEGYGFIAAFVAGLVLRRAEAQHEFHGTLHSFTQAIEHALTAILLILIGSVLPVLWSELDWQHVAISVALLIFIRPVIGWLGLAGTQLLQRERMVVAAFGVRGIGSIYYLAYAAAHVELVNEGQLWATIALTVALSTIIHGLTAGAVVERVTGDGQRASTRSARPAEVES